MLSKRSHIRSNYLDVNHTIIAGDLNTEMTHRNSLHTIPLEEYMKNDVPVVRMMKYYSHTLMNSQVLDLN